MASKKYRKKPSIVDRLVMGKEKSEGYARASLPSNRWELFWDIFKGRFWKLVGVNMLILLFFLPLIALLLMRYVMQVNYGAIYPFAQGFGIGYQAPTSVIGFAEQISVGINGLVYILLPLTFILGAVGISGGAHVIRNMVWSEGVFVSNDFWHGIKKNYKNVLLTGLLFSLCFYLFSSAFGTCSLKIALGSSPLWLYKTAQFLLVIFLIFASVCALHMIALNVNYELKFFHLLKNGLLFAFGLFPFNVVFGACCLIPYAITFIGGLATIIAYLFIILFGCAWVLLIWLNYAQWTFDRYINPKLGVKANKGIYEKVKSSSDSTLKAYGEQMQIFLGSSYAQTPIKPITDDELKLADLSEGYSRADIEKLNASRKMLVEDHEKYVKEHPIEKPQQTVELEEKMRIEREIRIAKAKRELNKRKRK